VSGWIVVSLAHQWRRVQQQDCQENKRGGSIKHLDTCDIEPVEDYQGQQYCFQIKVKAKSYILAAETEQERMNWMVEIVKLKGVPGIIALLDSPILSRHAAYALANLAGRTTGASPELSIANRRQKQWSIVVQEERFTHQWAISAACARADDSQLQIVAQGGVGPLLHYQKTCTDEILVDTIYYAISKLSTRRTYLFADDS